MYHHYFFAKTTIICSKTSLIRFMEVYAQHKCKTKRIYFVSSWQGCNFLLFIFHTVEYITALELPIIPMLKIKSETGTFLKKDPVVIICSFDCQIIFCWFFFNGTSFLINSPLKFAPRYLFKIKHMKGLPVQIWRCLIYECKNLFKEIILCFTFLLS